MSNETVNGFVADGYEPIKQAFAGNLTERGDVGASFSLWHKGAMVVDIAGGTSGPGGAAYGNDNLQLVFSTTKGATAICVGMCVERGLIDLDAPVARYWPEFAAAGKEAITVAELMSHRAGLPTIDAKLSLPEALEWATVTNHLAAQEPFWTPGTAHGYHALTYGWLAGELVRRTDGRSLGTFFAEEVAGPLGLDFWIGLPESLEARVAPIIPAAPPAPELAAILLQFMGPDTLGGRALSLNGAFALDAAHFTWNRRDVRAAEIPAANGMTNAASLARMYAACIGSVDGVRLLSDGYLERARTTLTSGGDRCLVAETTFGIGFMTSGPFVKMAGPGSFGHAGAGGSLGFAHPERDVAFGYVMNQMQNNLADDPRVTALTDAVLACT